MYITNAIPRAISAYINIFSSGCRNLFFLSHSRTSFSDVRSPKTSGIIDRCKRTVSFYLPLYMLGKRLRKYTMAGNFVTPHFLAYLGSAIFTKVISKLSVSPSMFSNFSNIFLLSTTFASSITNN